MLRHVHNLKEAVSPSKTSRAIHDALLTVLDDYVEQRAALGKTFKKHDIFHAGYAFNEKTNAIAQFKLLLNGNIQAVTDAEILILRNGKLGDAIRASVKQLAVDLERPDIATIRGTINQLRAHPYKPEVNVTDEAGNSFKKAKDQFNKSRKAVTKFLKNKF